MAKQKAPEGSTETLEVLPRVDPEFDGDVWGDPCAELMLSAQPSDRHPVYVHTTDIKKYQSMGYVEARAGEDGFEQAAGITHLSGESMGYRDHVLMSCDRELHDRRLRGERVRNEKLRESFMKKNSRGDVFVNDSDKSNGNGPRAMFQR